MRAGATTHRGPADRVPQPPAAPIGPASRWLHLPSLRGVGRPSLALAALLLALPALYAHPIHTSLAEADYNRTSGRLEVALRVFIDDFEVVLSAHAKQPVSLARMPAADFETLSRAYLAGKFTVRGKNGQLAPHVWVGREVKDAENELWFYFEIALPDGIEGCRLLHQALGEQFPNQINSVRVRDGHRQVTLVFLPRQTEKVVKFRPE